MTMKGDDCTALIGSRMIRWRWVQDLYGETRGGAYHLRSVAVFATPVR